MLGINMFMPSQNLLWVFAGLFALLSLGTIVRLALLRGLPDNGSQSHLKSVRSWWALAILLSVAVLHGNVGVAFLLAAGGMLSLREYLKIIGWEQVGPQTAYVIFAIVPIYYALLSFGHTEDAPSVLVLASIIIIGAVRASLGLVDDYIRITASALWSIVLFVYCLSHAYLLLTLPGLPAPWAGKFGWFLYLVFLTEANDIAQALIGRSFGRTKIAPRISPNKSAEGLLGGIITTTTLAVLLAPWLTSFMRSSWVTGVFVSVLSGLLIATFGFLGDLNKSGIKRDVGIKDSGTILPGQGGMMDRVDSLTFSAPVFYFLVKTAIILN